MLFVLLFTLIIPSRDVVLVISKWYRMCSRVGGYSASSVSAVSGDTTVAMPRCLLVVYAQSS